MCLAANACQRTNVEPWTSDQQLTVEIRKEMELLQTRVVTVETERSGYILKTAWTKNAWPSRIIQLALISLFIFPIQS